MPRTETRTGAPLASLLELPTINKTRLRAKILSPARKRRGCPNLPKPAYTDARDEKRPNR